MLRKFFRIVLPCLMSLMVLASASSINAFAVEKNDLDIQDIIDIFTGDDDQTDPVPDTDPATYPTDPEPEPTEPEPTEPVPVTTEPVTTKPAPVTTEPVETVAPTTENAGGGVDDHGGNVPFNTKPLIENKSDIDKSISTKTYSTDYTAGIVSWICVGVGLIVILVMLVSTKISGRKSGRRGI